MVGAHGSRRQAKGARGPPRLLLRLLLLAAAAEHGLRGAPALPQAAPLGGPRRAQVRPPLATARRCRPPHTSFRSDQKSLAEEKSPAAPSAAPSRGLAGDVPPGGHAARVGGTRTPPRGSSRRRSSARPGVEDSSWERAATSLSPSAPLGCRSTGGGEKGRLSSNVLPTRTPRGCSPAAVQPWGRLPAPRSQEPSAQFHSLELLAAPSGGFAHPCSGRKCSEVPEAVAFSFIRI